jgi:Associated with HOX
MSSSTTHPYLPGADRVPDHHQLLYQQQNQQGSHFYHVPQHSRREKLRYQHEETSLPVASLYSPHFLSQSPPGVLPEALPVQYNPIGTSQTGFSLSLSPSSSNNPRHQVSSGVPGPYGPFTGYAAVLGRSRFLGPARMLLEEICDVDRRELAQEMDTGGSDEGLLDFYPSERDSLSAIDRGLDGNREGSEFHWKKTRLLSLMEEVYLFSEYLILLFLFFCAP